MLAVIVCTTVSATLLIGLSWLIARSMIAARAGIVAALASNPFPSVRSTTYRFVS